MNILALGALGPQELILIFLVVLLLFGAKKIPELARGVGKGMGEFKKAKDEFEREIKEGEIEGAKEWERKPSSDTIAASDADHSDPHHDEKDKA